MMLLIEININICFAKENVFYTDSGIVLTQEQYNILSEVFSDEMIKSMPKDNLKSFINMDKINIYDEKKIYIRVDENLDSTRKKVINSNERIISKKEANYILNNSNVQTMSTSDSHNTAMKKRL